MGTSTSSSGGKAGSPFDPEWLAPESPLDGTDSDSSDASEGESADDGENDSATGDDGADTQSDQGAAGQEDTAYAPSRRFADARMKMGAYLAGGGRESLRSAAKSMVNKGMGGARQAASTMRGTAHAAGALGQFLASARDRSDPHVTDWVDRVRQANLSAEDLILELVKEVLPDAGSVDDESIRNAGAEALGQLYEMNPDIDFFALTDEQIHNVMAITIANDVCNRMDLQLGQTYERLKYDPREIQLYRKDMREYVQAEVRVVMERHDATGLDPRRLAREVLQSALEVFAS